MRRLPRHLPESGHLQPCHEHHGIRQVENASTRVGRLSHMYNRVLGTVLDIRRGALNVGKRGPRSDGREGIMHTTYYVHDYVHVTTMVANTMAPINIKTARAPSGSQGANGISSLRADGFAHVSMSKRCQKACPPTRVDFRPTLKDANPGRDAMPVWPTNVPHPTPVAAPHSREISI
jgi:hypothetical protein